MTTRLTYEEFERELQRDRDSRGSIPMETNPQDGRNRPVPSGGPSPAPWEPSRPVATGGGVLSAVQSAIDISCSLYRVAPETTVDGFTGGTTLPFLPQTGAQRNRVRNTLDRLCGDGEDSLPPQLPELPFEGGQCPIAYNFDYLIQGKPKGGSTQFFSNNVTQTGPFFPVVEQVSIGRYNHGIRGPNVQPPFGPAGFFNFLAIGGELESLRWQLDFYRIENLIVANDPGADPRECGDPDPELPFENIQTIIDFDLNIELPISIDGPNINIDLDLSSGPGGELNIDLSNDINVQIDVGGITINPAGTGGDSPTNTINNINATVDAILDIVNEFEGGECDLTPVLDLLNERFDSVDDAIECVEQLLRESNVKVPVKTENTQSLGTFVGIETTTVFDVDAARIGSAFLLVEVLSPVPTNVRRYKLEEESDGSEFALGNYRLKYSNLSGLSAGVPDAIWRLMNRRLFIVQLPDLPLLFGLYVSIKPDVIIEITDLGYTWSTDVLPDCEDLING